MERKNIFYVIDWILLIVLICVVIYAQVQGKYINKELSIVEVCNGIPTEESEKILLEYGYIKEEIREDDNIWEKEISLNKS